MTDSAGREAGTDYRHCQAKAVALQMPVQQALQYLSFALLLNCE